jgi:high affinity Mn2+ porin
LILAWLPFIGLGLGVGERVAAAAEENADAGPLSSDAEVLAAPEAGPTGDAVPAAGDATAQTPSVGRAPGSTASASLVASDASPTAHKAPASGGERWSANFQATYVWQEHPGFSAAYDGPHSLVHTAESGYSLTATLFLGFRPWRGTEIYANPEIIQSAELSHLHGLGGFSNSENQKTGGPKATLYAARAFIRQTINLGRKSSAVAAGPNQFAGDVSSRRLVVTAGRVALVDIFDNNAYAHDGRTQFMNWSFTTHAASDYAADARGYTWGLALEYYFDEWAFRFGRFAQPKESNGLAMDFKLLQHYGDNLEIEHAHSLRGWPGSVRLMGVRNYARMAAFAEAVDYALGNGGTPDLATVRHDQAKFALGIAIEQSLGPDAGMFGRLNWNDGRTETYAFTEVDRSLTVGAVVRGQRWHRPNDTLGLGLALNGISDAHRAYLARGGLGAFLGDGQLPNYAPEKILEAFYAFAAVRGLWTSAGYQLIINPAYNADRGPVSIFSIRFHAEY